MTVGELAAAMGRSRNTISRFINGHREPDEGELALIAQHLRTTPEWLRYGRGPMTGAPSNGATPATSLPRQLEAMALRFRAEALEMGADDEDMGFIDGVLKSPGTSIMVAGGYEAPKTPEAQRIEMESVVAMLRAWLEGRIEMRDEEKRRR